MSSDDWNGLFQRPEEVRTEYDSIPQDWLLRVENACLKVFEAETEWQHKVLFTVAVFYLNELGGEPKLCKDGSKIIQSLPRAYLNRAIVKAAIKLDRTSGHIGNMCIYQRYDGTDKRSVFLEELTDVQYRLASRVD